MGLAMGALAAEKTWGVSGSSWRSWFRARKPVLRRRQQTRGGRKKNTTELQCAKEYRTVLCQVLMGSMRGTSQHARPTGSHVVPEEETTSRSEGIEKTPWEHGKDPSCGVRHGNCETLETIGRSGRAGQMEDPCELILMKGFAYSWVGLESNDF